ncbi:type III pantothenate kinase [Pseudomonas sp. N040]|uniref:type III pantothenate kinase n=1 Tax=Pseudomonas sp. N040 TaxID=2785325 RepID=UPI0018A24A68|nr:type III pantothenate kinase [Pseudomonas sp. N040]MBF7731735.1 type III pantothenate kinase [Pseudomonas sp. N040]MBW7015379.1 type III pantothenate kinase [Pseudomonas sp. N040]
MILEIDCGNSLIKWRLFDADASLVGKFGAAADEAELREQLLADELMLGIKRIRLVSVRSRAETNRLVDMLKVQFSIIPEIAQPARFLAGVENGYKDYGKLGADRWLAVVAAYSMKAEACLVLDIGTAITADYVEAGGQHLGGYICPGLTLMHRQLSEHTGRISYVPGLVAECAGPPQTTSSAIECGCLLMLEGFIRTQLTLAGKHFGGEFCTILTGGDALLVAEFVPNALVIPDLVFRGLAIACPD